MAFKESSVEIFGQLHDYQNRLFTLWMAQQEKRAPEGSYAASISQLDEEGALVNLGKLPFLMVNKNGKLITTKRSVFRLTPKFQSMSREQAIKMLGSTESRSSERRWNKGGKR